MQVFACGALFACALVVLATPASAQQPQSTYVEKKTADGGQDIRFDDDPLKALVGNPVGAQLSGFHPPKRYDLCARARPSCRRC